jgi:hypothetical protein
VNFHHLGTQKNEVKLIESIFVEKNKNAKVIKEKANFFRQWSFPESHPVFTLSLGLFSPPPIPSLKE